MTGALIADTGGLLRALACRPDQKPTWPDYEASLKRASAVIVPSLVLAEVDYFLRDNRQAMRTLVAEILDPATTYEYELAGPADLVRALYIDARFRQLGLGLGLVDGLVAPIAERRGVYRILTSDRRDFGVVRVGRGFTRALTLVP